MKTIREKEILVASDFVGCTLKNEVVKHLEKKGWHVTDIGVQSKEDPTPEMYHRIGFAVGAKITEREFERALIFSASGMGIHIAAGKCPGVRAGVVDQVETARYAAVENGVNVLAMGSCYVTPELGKAIADAYLESDLGTGYEWWTNFYIFHKLAIDEINEFNYEEFKENQFQVNRLGAVPMIWGLRPDRAKG